MFKYFLTYETQLPEGVGFGMFTPKHWLALAVIALFIISMCYYYKSAGAVKRRIILRTVAVTALVLETVLLTACIIAEGFSPEFLPFHLCNLGLFVAAFHAFYKNKVTEQLLYWLTLPGTLVALFVPTWGVYPIINLFSLMSFSTHTLEIAFVLMQLTTGELKPQIKRIYYPVLFLMFTATPLYFLNRLWGTNFMFLNYAEPSTPLAWLESTFGSGAGYMLSFAGLLLAVWVLLYIPWILLNYLKGFSYGNKNNKK
jgi:hypothetical integral membrane protein (TIGR02206 family)